MPNHELVEYIEKELKKGIHIDRIKNSLFEVGHKIEHVEEAVLHVKRKNLKKNLLFVSSIVVVFLILIIFSFSALKMESSIFSKSEAPSSNIFLEMSDMELLNKVITTKDSSLCEYIEDATLKIRCIEVSTHSKTDAGRSDKYLFTAALRTGDPSLCNNIVDRSLKTKCVSMV